MNRTHEEILEAAHQILSILSEQATAAGLQDAVHVYLKSFDGHNEAKTHFMIMAGTITVTIIVLGASGASITLGHEETMKYVDAMIRRSEN